MKLTDRELARLYQEQTRRRSGAACPSAEELTQAAMDMLNETERGQLADHLAACRDCAEEYQVALALRSWAPEAAADLGLEEQNRRESETQRKPSWLERLGIRLSPAPAYAAALGMLVILAGLVVWIVILQRENVRLTETAGKNSQQAIQDRSRAEQTETQIAALQKNLDEMSAPQFNVPITDLVPLASSRGPGSDQTQKIDLPAGTNFFTVILNLTGQPAFTDYGFEVLDAQGKTVQEGSGLRRSAENTFTVALSRRFLPAGSYEFRVLGLDQNQRTLVQTYKVQLHYQ
jgi:hypothetical protein